MSKDFIMEEFRQQLDDIDVPTRDEIKQQRKTEPKHTPEFEDYFKEVMGKGFNFTEKELEFLKYSLKNTIQRWRVKDLIGKDEFPEPSGKLIWSWKMTMDKYFTIDIVKTITRYIKNKQRKMFGLKNSHLHEPYIAHMIDVMMKEGLTISYPDQELIDRFFRGGDLEGIE